MKNKLILRNLLSLILALSMTLTLAVPLLTVPVSAADADTIEVGTAEQLLEITNSGNSYKGKTIKLTADIDLNPGWNAATTVVGAGGADPATTTASFTVTFPTAPANKWKPIDWFEGTFDGQGHSIKGLYIDYAYQKGSKGKTAEGYDIYDYHNGVGFISWNDGTVKNVVFTNGLISVHHYKSTQTGANIRIGSVAGRNYGTIENVYSDMELWLSAASDAEFANIGGICGRFGDKTNTISNCVFAGKIGSLNGTNATQGPAKSVVYVSAAAGSCNSATGTIKNCLNLATFYRGTQDTKYKADFGLEAGKTTLTNNLVGKKEASFLTGTEGAAYATDWAYNETLGYVAPKTMQSLTSLPAGVKDILDYDGTEKSNMIFTVSNAAGLLYAAELSRSGVQFTGQTLKLTADIDLNPGWNAHVTVENGKGTLPEAPGVVFPGFVTLSGTLDGNGKTISGIFMTTGMNGTTTPNLAPIEFLRGTVKNLKINNSLICGRSDEEGRKISGLVARAYANALIDTVWLDVEVWSRSSNKQQIAGVVAKVEEANVTIRNTEFAGAVGSMVPDDNAMTATVPGSSTGIQISQLVSDGNWKTTLKIDNCFMNGTAYAASGVATDKAVAACEKPEMTINTVTERPAAVSSMNPTAYGATVPAFDLFPNGKKDSNKESYDADTRAQVRYYENVTQANAEAYYTSLTNAGYTLLRTYTLGGNVYKLFEKEGAYTVYTGWYAHNGGSSNHRMSVFFEPHGRSYNTASEAVTGTNLCTAQLWQLDVYNEPKNPNANGGMGYIIRLTDGTFVIVDGGYSHENDAKNIYGILTRNNVLSGKPVISAWFITHAHPDHYGALNMFAKLYSDSVTVKGFYYNLPGNDILVGTDKSYEASNYRFAEIMSRFDGAKLYSKMHTGMTVGFAGATATILYTHEEGTMSYYKNGMSAWFGSKTNEFADANDSSMVIRFTVGTQSFMVLGDIGENPASWLVYSHAADTLKSDLMQVAHHGYNYTQDIADLYAKINPDVALWPMDVAYIGKTEAENKELFRQYYACTDGVARPASEWIRENCDETIPAYENVCLPLPYAAKTYSGGQSLPDIETAYNSKITTPAPVTYIQTKSNEDGTVSLRLVGLTDKTEDELAAADSVAFDIILQRNGKIVAGTSATRTVYTSVLAAGETVTAESLGGSYLWCYVINGIEATDVITIQVRTRVAMTDGGNETSLYSTVVIRNGAIVQ